MTTPSEQAIVDASSPPAGLTKAEKSLFRRIANAQIAAGRPVLASQLDILFDYIAVRGRIAALRKMLRAELREKSDLTSSQLMILKLSRQLDSSAKLSLGLGEKLGINVSQSNE
jgi:hypothetical protein